MKPITVVALLVALAGCDGPSRSADRPAVPDSTPSIESVDVGVRAERPKLVRYEEPAVDPSDARVAILLHGFGSNERDLVSVARRVGLRGPLIAFRAPERAGRGWAWFPIDFESEPRYAPDAADAALQTLASELEAVGQEYPGQERVVLGFSQGAMMAMMLAVEHPDSLERAIALSGTLPRPVRPPSDFDPAEAPLIYAIHGTADQVVSLEKARRAQQWLEEVGAEPTYMEYDGMPHRISPAVIKDLTNYLRR